MLSIVVRYVNNNFIHSGVLLCIMGIRYCKFLSYFKEGGNVLKLPSCYQKSQMVSLLKRLLVSQNGGLAINFFSDLFASNWLQKLKDELSNSLKFVLPQIDFKLCR